MNRKKKLKMKELSLSTIFAIVLLAMFFIVPIAQGTTMTVVNNSEAINGNTTSPSAIIADPGPDGISLPEAMQAAISVNGPHTIFFHPSLQGTTIALTDGLPNLTSGLITIDGDIDGDGTSDITIDGANSSNSVGFRILASVITIKGLAIINFSSSGIQISTDSAQGRPFIEKVTLRKNKISCGSSGIHVYNWGQDCTVRDLDIIQNTLTNNGSCGIEIAAAMGPSMINNQIFNVKISENTISNVGYKIAVFAKGASGQGGSNNVLSGLEISNNTIAGHTNSSLLISAGNESDCQDNRLENLLISGNDVDGSPVTIEILGGVGSNTRGNVTSNVQIVWNVLRGGGIQLAGATGYNAHQNGIHNFLIGWNKISDCATNGMHICAGGAGASNNTINEITILNNLIVKNNDAGILCHGDDWNSPNNLIDSLTILNNTIAENGNSWAGGINLNSKHASNLITGVRIYNTILWDNDGNDCIRGSESPELVRFSLLNDPRYLTGDGNFYSSPKFLDSNNGDFHLKADSPCIDAGDNSAPALPTTDFEGDDRRIDVPTVVDTGNGTAPIVDMGADESVALNAMPYIPLLLLFD